MSYITTYTGKHFDPTCPEGEKIDIRDIAHALSLTCRGNGQVKTFFSVGQHCIHCALEAEARGYGRRLALACLLHDASECYMSDVPRPVKATMPQYKAVEERLLEQVYIKYLGSALTDEEEKLVKRIDNDMLYYDLLHLLNEKTEQDAPVMATAFSYEVLPFEQVERRYLELFARLGERAGEECVFMSQYLWHKSNYKMMKGKWKIGILLEAGYREVSDVTDLGQYVRLADHICFQSTILPYPQPQCSQAMSDREMECFCEGLKMAVKYFYPVINIAENAFLLIDLRYIDFSLCDVQEEAFTAAAIQWASEAFHFPMPHIEVTFDPGKTKDGWNGKYVYDFSDV